MMLTATTTRTTKGDEYMSEQWQTSEQTSSIFERPGYGSQRKGAGQFTSCCGASSKETEDGVVCRNCYNLIGDYYGLGEGPAFMQTCNFMQQQRFLNWNLNMP